jgi:acetyltransferase
LKIESLSQPVTPADLSRLSSLLAECVHSGASIGFVEPLAPGEVDSFWRKVCNDVAQGSRLIFVARSQVDGQIVGSAQLGLELRPNGRHRGEVQKVLVFPGERRKGIASALVGVVESEARSRGVTLLFLDTSVGKGGAQELYLALGYTYCGGIPGYALDPDGTAADNAIYFKKLG